MERRVLLAFVLGLLVSVAPFAVQSYMLNKHLLGLENQIGLIDQELGELWEEINALKEGSGTNSTLSSNFTSDWMNFTFTWGPDTQRIVQGTFRLEVSLRWVVISETEETLSFSAKINDDDYDELDCLVLVFDTNENGVIDDGDSPWGFFADNMIRPIVLYKNSILIATTMPIKGPAVCEFKEESGYNFNALFSSVPHRSAIGYMGNPAEVVKKGCENSMYILFSDIGGNVFVEFSFIA